MPLTSVQLDASNYVDITTEIDYTQLGWKDILSNMADMIPTLTPTWTDWGPSDQGMVLLQLLAGGLDVMAYRVDAGMGERSLRTCVLRDTAVLLGQLIDYKPAPAVSSETTVEFTVGGSCTIPQGTKVGTEAFTAPGIQIPSIVFETIEDLTITWPTDTGEVVVRQGETTDEVVGGSDGSSYQIFELTNSPVAYNVNGDSSLQMVITEAGVPYIWTEVDCLLEAGPTESVYETSINASGEVTVMFGDNVNGKIPAIGMDSIRAIYRVGGGLDGNTGAGAIKVLFDSIPQVLSLTNDEAATGGADAETVQEIKRNAPRSLRTVWKAVTAEDYKTLAETLPGVLKAYAVCGRYDDELPPPTEILYGPVPVALFIVPEGGGMPSDPLKVAVLAFFREREMLCSRTFVLDPVYVNVKVVIKVYVQENFLLDSVKTRVTEAIQDYFALENVDFGYHIYRSDFSAVVERLLGVDHSDILELYRTDGAVMADNVMLEVYEVPVLETLEVTVEYLT